MAETIFKKVCRRALYFSSFQRHPSEEFETLQSMMVNKYLANFSMFQSIPDAWSIDQLFPVLPLSRHEEKPSIKGTIVDITCDSDGCVDRFIDRREIKTSLDLHVPSSEPYFIGFFLVGAYQESLANEHNLFGAIHEIEVYIDSDGSWSVGKLTKGDPIDELLACRNYNLEEMAGSFKMQFESAVTNKLISKEEAANGLKKLTKYMQAYPYLQEN
jgi:arginine decarboxylase